MLCTDKAIVDESGEFAAVFLYSCISFLFSNQYFTDLWQDDKTAPGDKSAYECVIVENGDSFCMVGDFVDGS